MSRYVILTNRKRAIVALVHSVAFLILALCTLATVVRPLRTTSPPSAWVMLSVYLTVSSVLLTLTAFAGKGIERIYFGLCTASASFGFARQILGDPRMHAAVYIRVAMLACAVAAVSSIARAHRLPRSPA